jgi:hypothetical protein
MRQLSLESVGGAAAGASTGLGRDLYERCRRGIMPYDEFLLAGAFC